MAPERTRPCRRLLVVAAPGYGRTTVLGTEVPDDGLRCSARDALECDLTGATVVGVDDLDALAVDEQLRLVERLAALPAEVGFVLTSRTPLTGPVRRALGGQVHQRGPRDLALDRYAVQRLLADEYAVHDPEAAVRVHTLTSGWPALVHLVADELVRASRTVRGPAPDPARPGAAPAVWVQANVLPLVPDPLRQVLGLVAGLGPVSQTVCDEGARALGVPPPGDLASLAEVGLLAPAPLEPQQRVVVPLVAAVLAAGRRPVPRQEAALAAAALAWEHDGLVLPAARAWVRAGRPAEAERLLGEHGLELLLRGHAPGVVELLSERDGTAWGTDLRLTLADALRMTGDPPGALRAARPLVDRAGTGPWSPALAWRLAMVHYLLGDLFSALAALDRRAPAAVAPGPEDLLADACRAQVLAMVGRREEAAELAAHTLKTAELLGAPAPLAAAHVAASCATAGARKEAHQDQALEVAAAAGHLATVARVRANQACRLLASARYAEAVGVARESVLLGEQCSPPGLLASSLHNLGEALARTGEHDEARWHLERSVAVCRRLGPGRSATGLLGLADLHRELGRFEQARAAYDEAVALARSSGEVQLLVPALAGQARLAAWSDPEGATAAAQEAAALATTVLRPFALLALGRVALARGDREQAARHAAEAVATARVEPALDVLAEALELTADTAEDPATARAALGEALSIWEVGGAAPAAARVRVRLGWVEGSDAAARSRAREAARTLERLGVVRLEGRPLTALASEPRVRIEVLGGFTVTVDGAPVPVTAWRSRQARTLVKLLAARRGRPLTRSAVCELLWPDDDPARTGHRLSVLLTTVRGVLDPDRRRAPEHHVASDQSGLWLDLRHVALDAEDLVRESGQAAELLEEGDLTRAREVLVHLDRTYRGAAFEDEPYEPWADALREEARAAWIGSARRLVSLPPDARRPVDVQALLVRLLAEDPYDEQAHRLRVRSLVRAGRYGEARRAFARWAEAMREIEAPVPDPDVLHPTTPRPARPVASGR